MKLAEAYVEIKGDDRPLMNQMSTIRSKLTGMVSAAIPIGIGVGVAGITSYLGHAITAASDLTEALSKTEVVTGAASAQIIAFANQMNAQFGVSKTQILDAAAGLAMMGKEAKLSESDVARFAEVMVRLADDASSMFNTTFEEAFLKIRSGLSGESEPLRAFNVFLTEAAVKAEGARQGLLGLDGELSEGAKIMARAALIQKGLTVAMGDHERTMGSLGNQMKELKGRWDTIAQNVGKASEAPATFVISWMNYNLEIVQSATDKLLGLMGIQKTLTAEAEKAAGGAFKPGVSAEEAAAEAAAKRREIAQQQIAKEKEHDLQEQELKSERNRQAERRESDAQWERFKSMYPESVGNIGEQMAAFEEFRASERNAGDTFRNLKNLGGGLLGMAGDRIAGLGGLAGAAAGGLGGLLERVMKPRDRTVFTDDEGAYRQLSEGAANTEDNTDATRENTEALKQVAENLQSVGMKLGRGFVGVFGGS